MAYLVPCDLKLQKAYCFNTLKESDGLWEIKMASTSKKGKSEAKSTKNQTGIYWTEDDQRIKLMCLVINAPFLPVQTFSKSIVLSVGAKCDHCSC